MLHSIDRYPEASHIARHSTCKIDRQLYNSGQVSLMDKYPLAQIEPI